MLVQLGELPVHWVDVHVVVLLKVLRQQLNRVITSMQTSLALKDFLHLRNKRSYCLLLHGFYCRGGCLKVWGARAYYSKTLLGGEEAGCGRVVFVELQQHVFQPVSHSQRELDQLGVLARGND